jgi:hypothetical protein
MLLYNFEYYMGCTIKFKNQIRLELISVPIYF